MKYSKPLITNSVKAHQLIQGGNKNIQQNADNSPLEPQCTSPAYEADE